MSRSLKWNSFVQQLSVHFDLSKLRILTVLDVVRQFSGKTNVLLLVDELQKSFGEDGRLSEGEERLRTRLAEEKKIDLSESETRMYFLLKKACTALDIGDDVQMVVTTLDQGPVRTQTPV